MFNGINKILILSIIVVIMTGDANSNDIPNSSYKLLESDIKIAIKAIELAFKNIMHKPAKDWDFTPDDPGPFNSPFPKEKKYDYNQVTGYSYDTTTDILVIYLSPKYSLGENIAVEIDKKNNKVKSVYKYPDS